jgi:predicted dehydrogenase
MDKKLKRRDFLKNTVIASAGTGLGLTALNAKNYTRIQGANDRVNFAVAGVRSRGANHIESIANCQNAMITHVCDVDKRYLEKSAQSVKAKFNNTPVQEKDIRKILESKEIDALTIATPEHWHTPMALLGLQAGKHVYVEKPPAHNPAEGVMLIKAQNKYNLLVQMGNQQRSSKHTQDAMKKIHEGLIGKVYMGKAWYSNNRGPIGMGKELAVPEYLDWELWQGPAPRKPYRDNVHPYNWHWFWHWGTGETLNNGTHEIDLCLWALQAKYPLRISANGGRYHYQDDWEFYDTLITNFEYKDKMISWEGKSCNKKNYFDRGRGVTIHGTQGTFLIDRNGYEIYNANDEKVFSLYQKQDVSMGLGGGGAMTDAHFQNFINAITKSEKLNAPISEGNIAATILLISNIAWKLNRTIDIDQKTGSIKNDSDAMKFWSREYETGWEPKI